MVDNLIYTIDFYGKNLLCLNLTKNFIYFIAFCLLNGNLVPNYANKISINIKELILY